MMSLGAMGLLMYGWMLPVTPPKPINSDHGLTRLDPPQAAEPTEEKTS